MPTRGLALDGRRLSKVNAITGIHARQIVKHNGQEHYAPDDTYEGQ
jgi:hypothetical protein